MTPAERIEAVKRDLVVEQGFAPLAAVLPVAGHAEGSFNACVARIDSRQIQVHAFLAWHGQDAADLEARSSALRRALSGAFHGSTARISVTLFLVAESMDSFAAMDQALKGVEEGHFLASILIATAKVAALQGKIQHLGRLKPVPVLDWFEERFSVAASHPASDVEAILRKRSEDEDRARILIGNGGEARATWILIALNASVYGLQLLSPPDQIIELGANQGSLVFGGHQFWRLLSCMFLHASLVHLLFNMVSLFSLGSLIERLAGPMRMLGLYFIAGLCGSLLSAFNPSNAMSIGASGAIFGLAGSLMALRFRRPRGFPEALGNRIFHSLSRPVLLTFAMGLGLAFMGSPILFDNWAHFGGLLAGFGLVWFQPKWMQKPYPPR